MSRKLPLTQKQITAICKGAAKAGYVPIIEVEGVSVRLVPDKPDAAAQAATDNIEVRF